MKLAMITVAAKVDVAAAAAAAGMLATILVILAVSPPYTCFLQHI